MDKQYVYAPVVLFTFNRPHYTREILDNLNGLEEATETRLFIFSDEAKLDKDIVRVKEVRNVISDFVENRSKFEAVYLTYAEQNQGLACSIINGVSKIIKEYGKVIVLEDDLVVSQDFLSYMNEALEFYKDVTGVWAISGYTFPMDVLNKYPYDIYLSGRGCSWGWATWEDRWETIDWQVKDYNSIKYNVKKRMSFAQWGRDLPTMLDAYMNGTIRSWAIRWCYSAFKQEKYTVYPKYSRVLNRGTDGSGTNFTHVEQKYNTELYSGRSSCKFGFIEADDNIRKEFAKKYLTNIQYLKAEVRWLLVKLGMIKR